MPELITTNRPVYLIVARDKVVAYLDHNVRASLLFSQRVTTQGAYSAHVQAVREAVPDLPCAFEDDVAAAVARVLKSRAPRMVRPVRRNRRAA
jgi:hypothetical protein